jgi:cell division septation protein DedD
MPAKKKKTRAAPKKPFKVLTRKAVIGWLVAIFIACGWMFALGVLVGRDQAPIEFDVDALEKKINQLRQKQSVGGNGGVSKNTGAPRDKQQLDFYEALPENREDIRIPKKTEPKPSPGSVSTAKPKPSPKVKDPRRLTAVNVPKGAYTIQVASVRNKPDADRLIAKLTRRGYPAYLLTSRIKGKGTWHRVRIGAYPASDAAKPVLAELRRSGMKPMLVKTK